MYNRGIKNTAISIFIIVKAEVFKTECYQSSCEEITFHEVYDRSGICYNEIKRVLYKKTLSNFLYLFDGDVIFYFKFR